MKLNLNTTVWGPSLWRVLHSLSFSIEDGNKNDRKNFLDVLESLRSLLPCEDCRQHFCAYMKENNPNEAADLAVWTFDFHNAVNTRLGKPQYGFNDVSKLYMENHCDMKCASSRSASSRDKLKHNGEKMDYGMLILLILLMCISTSFVVVMRSRR
jgi:hypothetical protein